MHCNAKDKEVSCNIAITKIYVRLFTLGAIQIIRDTFLAFSDNPPPPGVTFYFF